MTSILSIDKVENGETTSGPHYSAGYQQWLHIHLVCVHLCLCAPSYNQMLDSFYLSWTESFQTISDELTGLWDLSFLEIWMERFFYWGPFVSRRFISILIGVCFSDSPFIIDSEKIKLFWILNKISPSDTIFRYFRGPLRALGESCFFSSSLQYPVVSLH